MKSREKKFKECRHRDVKQISENVTERTGNLISHHRLRSRAKRKRKLTFDEFPSRFYRTRVGKAGTSWLIWQTLSFFFLFFFLHEPTPSAVIINTSVNSAFNTLRLLIPTEPKNRKLSKIETLRLAKSYIAHLKAVLHIGEFRRCSEFDFLRTRKFDLIKFFADNFPPFQAILFVVSHASKSQSWKKLREVVKAAQQRSIIVAPTSAHSVYRRRFIKCGLIETLPRHSDYSICVTFSTLNSGNELIKMRSSSKKIH